MNMKLAILASSLLIFTPVAQSSIFGVSTETDHAVVMQTPAKSDVQVTKDVKDAFAKDASLAPFAAVIVVDTAGGVVTLTGVVETPKAKSDFGDKAMKVQGVSKVNNNLEVKK